MAIATALFSLIGGPIVSAITDVWKANINKEISEAELEAQVKTKVMEVLGSISASQASVIIAEIQSEDWLTRNWRPIVALTAFFSYWYVIILYPHLYATGLFGATGVRFGEVGLENLFWLTTIAVGGYVGGRSLEKMTDKITKRWS